MDNNGKQIQQMFSSVAYRYDLLNRLLSCGIDMSWRRQAIQSLPLSDRALFLDIAAGTCDVSLEILQKKIPHMNVIGIDFSLPMLKIGKKKIARAGGNDQVSLHYGDAQHLPFKNNSFDGSIIAFGLRNVKDRVLGISEMIRVVKQGGKVVILEFTTPDNGIFRSIYYLYFRKLLPIIGGIISGKKEAYQYLPESVIEFPSKNRLKTIMENAGLKEVHYSILTFGIAAIHVGTVDSQDSA